MVKLVSPTALARRKEYSRLYRLAHKAERKAYQDEWRAEHRDAIAAKTQRDYLEFPALRAEKLRRAAAWRTAHPLYTADYYAAHKGRCKAATAAYHAAHPEQYKAYAAKYRAARPGLYRADERAWKARNKGAVSAATARRRASKLKATPKWLTKQQRIQTTAIYQEARRLTSVDGVARHVDHIYPLKGTTCSGLHVPWNLQILTAIANLKKSNRIVSKKETVCTNQ